jgi:hypothetical protein
MLYPPLAGFPWYKDVIYFLHKLQPPDGMKRNKERYLNLKAIRYFLIDQVLYWKDFLGVLLICLDPHEEQGLWMTFMIVCLGGIIYGKSQLTKYSGLGTTGLLCSLMFVRKSRLVSNVRNSLERSNSSLFY